MNEKEQIYNNMINSIIKKISGGSESNRKAFESIIGKIREKEMKNFSQEEIDRVRSTLFFGKIVERGIKRLSDAGLTIDMIKKTDI